MVLLLHNPQHVRMLQRALAHADTLVGSNILFDLSYLSFHPHLVPLLTGRHFLIDTLILNYLHSELRPERSLKTIGPLLRRFSYDRTLHAADGSFQRFTSPSDPAFISYCAADTHNTLLAVQELARRTTSDFGVNSPKLSARCLAFYSDLIWTSLRQSHNGIPLSATTLFDLHVKHTSVRETLSAELSALGLTIQGKGSIKSKFAFMSELFLTVPSDLPVKLTKKTKQLSIADTNRYILTDYLEDNNPSHHALPILRKWDEFGKSKKLLDSYLSPLLSHPLPTKGSGLPWISSSQSVALPSPSSSPSLAANGDPKPCLPPWPRSLELSVASLSPSSSSVGTPSGNSDVTGQGKLLNSSPPAQAKPIDSSSPTLTTQASLSPSNKLPSPSSTNSNDPKTKSNSKPSTLEAGPPNPLPKKKSEDTKQVSDEESTPTEPLAPPLHNIIIGFPTIFIVPSKFHDNSELEGGQKQVRPSFKDPAVQTFPAPIKKAITSRWGAQGRILSRDASQVELRVAAILSGEPTLLDSYNKGLDLHTDLALYISRISPSTFTPAMVADTESDAFKLNCRQPSKHSNFTILNRGGPDILQKTIRKKSGQRISFHVCDEIIRAQRSLRPTLISWQQSVIREAHLNGRLILPLTGQSRYYSQDDDPGEIINFQIQGLAATLTCYVSIFFNRALSKNPTLANYCKPFTNWYDALWFDVHESAISETHALTDTCVQEAINDYWLPLCAHFNRSCPMSYSYTLHLPDAIQL